MSCRFDRGKAYAIVGKSGSGKTTLLSLLAGLELPSGGQVAFEETPTTKTDRDRYRREHAVVIYRSYNLFPLLTAMENVLYSMKLKGVRGREARERAEKELLAVAIGPEQFRRFPAQMSGGAQRKRAAVFLSGRSEARTEYREKQMSGRNNILAMREVFHI